MSTDDEPITNDTYAAEMNAVMVCVRVLETTRVAELLDMVQKAETLAPIFEPTAYQRGGHRRLNEQRRLLTACAEVLRVLRQIDKESADVRS